METRLRSSRAAWQRILADEIVDRWHGGPFAAFLRAAAAIGGLWPRVRAASGGLVGRLLAGHSTETIVAGRDGWQAVAELGLSAADVEQSRSVLSGLATRARLAEPLVGRAALDESQVSAIISRLLDRTAAWLSVGVDRLVAARRGRLDGPFLRWGFELLFSALLAAVLMRAAWNFFVGHLWFGRPLDGGGFLQEAIIWVVVWGLALRWIVFSVFRAGLDGDIHTLVERLPEARLTDPLVADFRSAADAASRFLEDADRLARRHETLNAALAEPGGELGRLLGRAPSSGA